MKKYNAVIIGCGSIGALKPGKFDLPKTKNILTHAHAIYNNPNIELIGVIDTDHKKAEEAAKKWKTNIWDRDICPDIIAISTPTKMHFEVFDYITNGFSPKLIIGEKPFGSSLDECKHMLNTNIKCPILINYNRRFEPHHQNIKKAIDLLTYDNGIYSCHVLYGRGLMHDGCHALDLMNFWFGRLLNSRLTNSIIEENFKNDPSHGFIAEFEHCPQVIFTPVNSKYVGLFEIRIMTKIGEYLLTNNGTKLILREVKKGDQWGDYQTLSAITKERIQDTQLTSGMKHLYHNVVNYFSKGEPLKCTGLDALKVWETYNKIVNRR